MKFKKKSTMCHLLVATVCMFVFTNCDDGEEPIVLPEDKEFNEESFRATSLNLTDVAENGDASDFQLTFTGASSAEVNTYRIVLAKSETDDAGVQERVASLNTDQYMEVDNNSATYNLNLDSDLKTVEDEEVIDGLSYKAYVIALGVVDGTEKQIASASSGSVELVKNMRVTTLVQNFNATDALSIDTDGNLYCSNYAAATGTNVVKITPGGQTSVFVDGLNAPVGNRFDSKGNFYVIHNHVANNYADGQVLKVTPSGEKTTFATITGYPSGITSDEEDNLYVSNYSLGKVTMVDTEGNVSVYVQDDLLRGGVGIDFDENGNLLVGNFTTGGIYKIDAASKAVEEIAQLPKVAQDFIIGYIDYYEGHIYATAFTENLVYKVSLDGTVEILAGNQDKQTVDGIALESSFDNPNGIVIDKAMATLYVSEGSGKALRKIELED